MKSTRSSEQSQVVLQMSTREGFGLTVAEALWKGVPVVGSKVGGIPLQIIDGENGFLGGYCGAGGRENVVLIEE